LQIQLENWNKDEITNEEQFIEIPDSLVSSLTKSQPQESNDLTSSDFAIGSDGNLFEDWKSIETFPAKLIEVTKDSVLLECLVDSQKGVFEIRKFKRSLLENKIPFKNNTIVEIRIFERPGKFVVEFQHAINIGYEKYFELPNIDVESIFTGSLLK
jgi:hypothetical protein